MILHLSSDSEMSDSFHQTSGECIFDVAFMLVPLKRRVSSMCTGSLKQWLPTRCIELHFTTHTSGSVLCNIPAGCSRRCWGRAVKTGIFVKLHLRIRLAFFWLGKFPEAKRYWTSLFVNRMKGLSLPHPPNNPWIRFMWRRYFVAN